MKIFFSFAEKDKDIIAQVVSKLRLQAHEVFFSKDTLPPGQPYDERIKAAVDKCDIFVFFISPESVSPGRYTLTELGYAKKRWYKPDGTVLPVMVRETPSSKIDPYLSTLTYFETKGNFATEVANAISEQLDHISNKRNKNIRNNERNNRYDGNRDAQIKNGIAVWNDELVDRLSKQRKLSRDSPEYAENSRLIDALVTNIKILFEPKRGTEVAGAKLEKVVGVGNFGTVWKAISLKSGKPVAIKVFRLERLAEGQMLSRFQRSIRAMRILCERKRRVSLEESRGHIVQFHEADETNLAFSMDLLTGGNLENINQFAWTIEKKLKLMISICEAVGYSHVNGIIHRDIKPANIILNKKQQPVLTDFDISDVKWATGLSTTVEGGLGTPVFAAPEQLEDADTANEQSDIYSLGRLLYYLLLERSPGYQVEKDPSLENLKKYPPAIVELVRRATQYKMEKRFSSTEEMVAAIEKCKTGTAAWNARTARTKRWIKYNWAALVIIIITLIGFSGFAMYQSIVNEREKAAERESEIIRRRANAAQIAEEEAKRKIEKITIELKEIRKGKIEYTKRINELEENLKLLEETKSKIKNRPRKLLIIEERIENTKKDLESVRNKLVELKKGIKKLEEELEKYTRPKVVKNYEVKLNAGEKNNGIVSYNAIKLKGTLTKTVIKRTVGEHKNEIFDCYRKQFLKNPDFRERVTVKFTISGTGVVKKAEITNSTLNNSEIESCITQTVRKWKFPQPEDGGTIIVNYPFVLTSSNDDLFAQY